MFIVDLKQQQHTQHIHTVELKRIYNTCDITFLLSLESSIPADCIISLQTYVYELQFTEAILISTHNIPFSI